MRKRIEIVTLALVLQVVFFGPIRPAHAQAEKSSYPAMASLDHYLIPDKDSEIALARSAAPKSIADGAEVLVLGRQGYTTAVEGTNGFLCVVERSWGAHTDFPEFWNDKIRAPICFNSAARSFAQIYLMKTKLVLAGKSKTEIVQTISAALEKKELRPLEPGAMSYMLSKGQYLNDGAKNWHPHVMFLIAGDASKSWGADQDDSPIMADKDPEEAATIFMLWVPAWSDGTPASMK